MATKIFFACFLGAFIGTLVAMSTGTYWWSGLLIGGLIGYLSYEVKAVAEAVKTAITRLPNWQTIKSAWPEIKFKSKIGFWAFLAALSFAPFQILLSTTPVARQQLTVVEVALNLVFFLSLMVLAIVMADIRTKQWEYISKEEIQKEKVQILRKMNFLFVWCYYLPKGLFWLLCKVPRVFLLIGQLIKQVFILIHSEIRLLCGIDATLGALIGYLSGIGIWSLILGGIAGGLLGVANYYLISIKLLKLVPARAS